jgi:acyl dehydratase
MEQIFFEEVTEGGAIPHEVRVEITTRGLAQWTCAVGDFFEIHYDGDYARAMGLPNVIVHGPFKCALLARMLTEWIGERGTLHRLTCQHRRMDIPGDVLVSRGRVLRKLVEDGVNLVECEVWVENQEGRISAPGRATVSLPSRERA